MTAAASDILLLADDRVASELTSLAGPEGFVHRRDPYRAIGEFARRPYRAVIMTHPYPDFAGLVRGFRRLRGAARCYALCSPAGEAELRLSGPAQLDDYFIYPPSSQELRRIIEGIDPPAVAARAETAELSPEEMAELVEAAGSFRTLGEHVAHRVAEWTALAVEWAPAAGAYGNRPPLLLLGDDPPRVLLVPEAAEISPTIRRKIASLQAVLGALSANASRTDALHRLAITDHLTGAYNRRYFYHFTDSLLARASQEHTRVTLLLYDIDDFKRYNDTYGHAAGDEILRETASLMKQTTREHDVVARIGGDEFAVLFWDTEPPRQADSHPPEDAQILAQRFIGALATHVFPSLGPEAKGVLTISGGLATFPRDGASCRKLLSAADMGLRQAKQSGKNAIHLVGTGGEAPKPIRPAEPAAAKRNRRTSEPRR